MQKICRFVVTMVFVAVGTQISPVSAATISLIGDVDCFDYGGVCPDGSTLAFGPLSGAPAEAGDTDTWRSSIPTSWTHIFAPGTYGAATLTFRTLGFGDVAGPYTVLVDGTSIGLIPTDGFGHLLVETFAFAVPTALLLDGSATVTFGDCCGGDGYAIDFAELSADGAAVPEPSTLMLLSTGLVAGVVRLRRRMCKRTSS